MNESMKAIGSTIISWISATYLWISLKDMQVMMAAGASAAAIISGFFAARYYYLAGKEKKESLKKLKSNP